MRSNNFFVLMFLAALPAMGQSSRSIPTTQPVQQHHASEFLTDRSHTRGVIDIRADRIVLIDPQHLAETFSTASHLLLAGFPISTNEDADLDLSITRPVVDARTEVWVGTASGDVRAEVPHITSYRGVIRGEASSRVFVNIVNGEMIGVIQRGDGTQYVIGPSGRDGAEVGEHVLVKESSFNFPHIENMMRCDADRTPNYFFTGKQEYKPKILSTKLLEVEVAVEADSAFYWRTGGTTARATAYIASLFAMVSSIYEDELNVTFHVPWVKVWSSADPYNVNGDGYGLFNVVPTYWKAHYQNVQRDLVHVMTSSQWGGGGVGFRGQGFEGGSPALCSTDYGYSVSSPRGVLSYPTFAFTYDAYIVAHEIGHNFGARHTHDCWWNPALDTCLTKDDSTLNIADACYGKPITPRPSPGTIMSYCTSANYQFSGQQFDSSKVAMTFSPRVAAVMRQEAELAACLTEPVSATIILTNPRGATQKYVADSTMEIRWTSSNVSNVTMEYSEDGGTNWKAIASGVPVSPQAYQWKIPNICSKKVLVRIQDAANAGVADTSLLPFGIGGNTLTTTISVLGSTVMCAGDTAVIDAGVGYASYRWSTGETTQLIRVGASGSYWVTVTNADGCWGISDTIRVTVRPNPATPIITASNDTLTSTQATAYQWYLDGAPINGATGKTHIATSPGHYTVRIADANGCTSTSAEFPYGVQSGIADKENAVATLSLSIDPSQRQLTIRFALASPQNVTVRLFNNAGEELGVLFSEHRTSGAQMIQHGLESLASGSYFVRIEVGDGVGMRRFSIVR